MHTMLVGITVVRLLGKQGEPAAARKVVDALWPLVADDADLDVQRVFLGSVAAHALPGDQIGCAARQPGGRSTSEQERDLSAAAAAAGRVHALVHQPVTADPWAEGSAMRDVLAQAPHLAGPIAGALVSRTWEAARLAQDRPAGQSILLWINVVTMLIQHRFPRLAMVVLKLLEEILHDAPAEVFATMDLRQVLPDVLRMADTVFAWLPEACCRSTAQSLGRLLAQWAATPGTHVKVAMALMNYLKGRPLASALVEPGPTPTDPQIAHAIRMLTDLGAGIHYIPEHPAFATIIAETLPTGYLHGAEREPGSTIAQQRANVRRKAQSADTFRLLAAISAAPIRRPDLLLEAVPDDAVLLSMHVGAVGLDALEGFHAVLYAGPSRLRVIGVYTPNQPVGRYIQLGGDMTDELGTNTRLITPLGSEIGRLRRLLLEDPLHRDVSRAGAGALADFAEYLSDVLLEMLGEFAASSGRSRLVFWPHESLYFLPLHLVPFQGGILADHFTVTVLPSVECLFRAGKPVPAAHPGVRAIACAAGGLSVGLPEEPSLHEQAKRIAALFGTRPLIGDDATPADTLATLGSCRYLHLAAHGRQDADAPLFARLYLAGGALHAYQILEQDLRGTELVTLSACESALLRYDFLDNLYGIAPAFLRAGARAVVGALWPVSPDVAETFFTTLYTYLADDGIPVAAFRYAQNHARARHPNYRDWGAFIYMGA